MHLEKYLKIPLYPLLLSLYPILSLLGVNIVEIVPGEALRSGLVALLIAGTATSLAYLVFHDWHRAALAATVFLAFFFSYGHIYNLVKQITLRDVLLGRHRFIGPLWFGLLVAGGWRIKTLAEPRAYTRPLNLLAVLLLIYPAIQVAPAIVRTFRPPADPLGGLQATNSLELNADLPDIYYIIPDAYTRDDTLLDFYEFDNTPFLTALENRGFYVARCSQSNYARTYLSLSSSLNLDYIQELSPTNDSEALTTLIKQSRVRQTLEALGYTTVAFDAGYFRTQWPDADHYLSLERSGEPRLIGISEFETILLETTIIRFLLDGGIAIGGDLLDFVYESNRLERYNRTLFILDNAMTITSLPGPKFVFIHIPTPHEPYIFSAAGEFIPDREAYVPGYPDQVAYLNTRLLEVIDEILANSDSPPIIILQGDHGGFETKDDFRRLHILNAYYLPDGSEDLYPAITPVNTFRLIFDHYFGEDLGLLPDISYYSTSDRNFRFTIAPVDRPGCE